MIAKSFIEEWGVRNRWQTERQVEQDLVISRALVCLYNDPLIKDSLVFRGGTALNKLFLKPPARYSEDIDFVQARPEPIGQTINRVRDLLKPWLGNMQWKITERSAKFFYPYQAIDGFSVKLKIEINTVEHFQVRPLKHEKFKVQSEWFSGECEIITYELVELMATKLRALYQRRKGRDLFDIWYVLKQNLVDIDQVLEIFYKYCAKDQLQISQKSFRDNMELKKLNTDFRTDMEALIPKNVQYNFDEAFDFVQNYIVSKLAV